MEEHVSKIQAGKTSQSTVRKITAKVPKPNIGFNTKKIIIALSVILALVIAKTGLDLYLGSNSLKSAKDSLFSGDFEKAHQKANSAANFLQAAENKLRILTKPLSLVAPKRTEIFISTISSAQSAGVATEALSQALNSLFNNLNAIASDSSSDESTDFELTDANLKLAHRKFIESYQLARIAQQDKAGTYQKLASYALIAHQLVNFIPEIVSPTEKRNYLVLVLYNDELRPGGGFIGTFGEVTFENGRLSDSTFNDVRKIDSKLQEVIESPAQIQEKLFVDQLFLRDSNFSPDFSVNSSTAVDIYKKETAQSVDGVIAFDLTFIKNLIQIAGPVTLSEFNDKITNENFNDKIISYSKEGKGEDFLTELIPALVDDLIKSLGDSQKVSWQELADTVTNALAQKHLLLQFENKNLSDLVKSKSWGNSLPPVFFDPIDEDGQIRDYLSISEANLGANRANKFLDRKIDYQVEIDKDSNLNITLKIAYTNNSQSTIWPEGNYVNFLRIYTPFASTLIKYQNGKSTDSDEVEVTTQGNLTIFSTFVEVPPNSTQEVSFSYRVPKNTNLAQTPTYHLYIQKQPGTAKDPLTFTLGLPSGYQIESVSGEDKSTGQQSAKIETNLETDRQFEIEITKK